MIVPDVDPLLHTHDSRSPRHEAAGTAGNLTTDAHLAALAIEHRAELHSTGADIARFPGFNRVNPLVWRHVAGSGRYRTVRQGRADPVRPLFTGAPASPRPQPV